MKEALSQVDIEMFERRDKIIALIEQINLVTAPIVEDARAMGMETPDILTAFSTVEEQLRNKG